MEARPHRHRHRRAARPLRRRHRPDHPERLAQAGRAHRLREGPVLRVARRPRLRAQPASSTPAPRSSSPAPTSAPARPASTPCGPSSTTASRRSSRPASATSSATTRTKNGLVPVVVAAEVGEQLLRAVEADPTSSSPSTSSAGRSRRPALGLVVRVPARRRPSAPLPRGPRRHRPHPPARRRHRRLRGRPAPPGSPPPAHRPDRSVCRPVRWRASGSATRPLVAVRGNIRCDIADIRAATPESHGDSPFP